MNKGISAALLAALLLSGCSITPTTSSEVVATTTKRYDQYTGITSISTRQIDIKNPSFGSSSFALANLQLMTYKGARTVSIVIDFYGNNWLFLDTAFDSSSKQLTVQKITRRVEGGGSIFERIAIDVPEAYLQSKASTGLDIRATGSNGALPIKIPPYFIEGFLLAIK